MLRPDDTPTDRIGPSASSADPGLVLAVDIGTTAVKVEVVDTAAVSNCGAGANTRREPQPGWAEQDPESIAGATRDAGCEVAGRTAAMGRTVAGCSATPSFRAVDDRRGDQQWRQRAALAGTGAGGGPAGSRFVGLTGLAATVPPGTDGLLMLPYRRASGRRGEAAIRTGRC
jgi:hypothetical protein